MFAFVNNLKRKMTVKNPHSMLSSAKFTPWNLYHHIFLFRFLYIYHHRLGKSLKSIFFKSLFLMKMVLFFSNSLRLSNRRQQLVLFIFISIFNFKFVHISTHFRQLQIWWFYNDLNIQSNIYNYFLFQLILSLHYIININITSICWVFLCNEIFLF